MRVTVLGVGEIGSYVAARLSREGHDVVVIDSNRRRLQQIDEGLDVMTVFGSGSSPTVLREARLDRTELLVAVTNHDEVNLIACLQAKQMGDARTVARLEQRDLRSRSGLDVRKAIGVDLVLDPDDETAQEILDLLSYQGASNVAEMAGGEVLLIGARLHENAPLVGRRVSEIAKEYSPEWDFLFGTITRNRSTIIVRADHVLEAHDLIRVVTKRRGRSEIMGLLGLKRNRIRKVLLLGGGRTAELLAERLCPLGIAVVVVDVRVERCQELSESIPQALVLQGDITDIDLLVEEDVGSFDAVVALTGEDDANILACLFAKAEGAGETIAVVHRLSLLGLLEKVGIDAALSPRTASANSVLRFVRGDVAAVETFLEGEAEVIELVVKPGSRAIGIPISDLHLPRDVLIGAIVRDGKAEIARGRSVLRVRDHVIVFAMPQTVDEVHRAFG